MARRKTKPVGMGSAGRKIAGADLWACLLCHSAADVDEVVGDHAETAGYVGDENDDGLRPLIGSVLATPS